MLGDVGGGCTSHFIFLLTGFSTIYILKNDYLQEKTMKHYLIDYENIQPDNFNRLNPGNCHIWLFVGKAQTTLPIGFMQTQAYFGNAFHIVQIPKSGRNALDFVLATEIGRITKDYPQSEIVIISKDKGFDVLIDYYSKQHFVRSIRRVSHVKHIQADSLCEKKRIPIHQIMDYVFFPKVQKYYQKLPERYVPKNEQSLHNFIQNILCSELRNFDEIHKQNVCQQLATYLI